MLGSQGSNPGAEGERSTSMVNELFSSGVMGFFLLFFSQGKKKKWLLCREGGLELLLASGRALGGGEMLSSWLQVGSTEA